MILMREATAKFYNTLQCLRLPLLSVSERYVEVNRSIESMTDDERSDYLASSRELEIEERVAAKSHHPTE